MHRKCEVHVLTYTTKQKILLIESPYYYWVFFLHTLSLSWCFFFGTLMRTLLIEVLKIETHARGSWRLSCEDSWSYPHLTGSRSLWNRPRTTRYFQLTAEAFGKGTRRYNLFQWFNTQQSRIFQLTHVYFAYDI